MVKKISRIQYCDNCGLELHTGDLYCSYCGQQVIDYGAGLDESIKLALGFINRLRTDKGYWYYEVLDPGHGDHKVWPQSQFLLYVLFTAIGIHEPSYLASAARIVCNTDMTVCAVDRLERAGQRFCVLLGDTDDFYLKGEPIGSYRPFSDENSLLIIYRTLTNQKSDANALFNRLAGTWDRKVNLLGLDEADRKKQPQEYEIYKTALFGIAAKAIGNAGWTQTVQSRLRQLQTRNGPNAGGWKTGLRPDGPSDGIVENLETTTLSILALLPNH